MAPVRPLRELTKGTPGDPVLPVHSSDCDRGAAAWPARSGRSAGLTLMYVPRHKEGLQQKQKNNRPVQLNDGDEMLINNDKPERTNVD